MFFSFSDLYLLRRPEGFSTRGWHRSASENKVELVSKRGTASVIWTLFGYEKSDTEQKTVLCKKKYASSDCFRSASSHINWWLSVSCVFSCNRIRKRLHSCPYQCLFVCFFLLWLLFCIAKHSWGVIGVISKKCVTELNVVCSYGRC